MNKGWKETKKYRKWAGWFVFLMIFSIIIWEKQTQAKEDKNITYEQFYDPGDEWGNQITVNMDGEAEFVIPDFYVNCAKLLIVNGGSPEIKKLTDSQGNKVQPELTAEGTDFKFYSINQPVKGDWSLQLGDGSWEKVDMYLLLYSSIKARFSFEKELGNPDSNKYQAMIRFYDSDGKKIELEENAEVTYALDVDGVKYGLSSTEKQEDYYIGVPWDQFTGEYTAVVVVRQNEDRSMQLLADVELAEKKEFKEVQAKHTPSLWKRFQKKTKEEKREILFTALIMILIIGAGAFIAVKTKFGTKTKEEQEKKKEQYYLESCTLVNKMQEHVREVTKMKRQIEEMQDDIIPYASWCSLGQPYEYIEKQERNLIRCQKDNRAILLKWEGLREQDKKHHIFYYLFAAFRRKKKDMISVSQSKHLYEQIKRMCDLMECVYKAVEDNRNQLFSTYEEIKRLEARQMGGNVRLIVKCGELEYRGTILGQLPGGPIEKGIKEIGRTRLRGNRIIYLDDLLEDKNRVCLIFDEEGNPVLVSNYALLEDEEKLNIFGPYQYHITGDMQIQLEQEILIQVVMNRF